ncbi:MAG: hypothetical protein EBY48_04725 [Opitutae bacterium]|nr:hypothetical protein [Opitutae bacterium]
MDKIKRYDKQANHLLNLVQAAHLLGYKDYRMIESLIDQGFIKAHTIGKSKKLKVFYHDLMKFPLKEEA